MISIIHLCVLQKLPFRCQFGTTTDRQKESLLPPGLLAELEHHVGLRAEGEVHLQGVQVAEGFLIRTKHHIVVVLVV